MLNKYETFLLGQETNSKRFVYQMENTVYTISFPWIEYENLQQTSHIILKDMSCIFLIVFL